MKKTFISLFVLSTMCTHYVMPEQDLMLSHNFKDDQSPPNYEYDWPSDWWQPKQKQKIKTESEKPVLSQNQKQSINYLQEQLKLYAQQFADQWTQDKDVRITIENITLDLQQSPPKTMQLMKDQITKAFEQYDMTITFTANNQLKKPLISSHTFLPGQGKEKGSGKKTDDHDGDDHQEAKSITHERHIHIPHTNPEPSSGSDFFAKVGRGGKRALSVQQQKWDEGQRQTEQETVWRHEQHKKAQSVPKEYEYRPSQELETAEMVPLTHPHTPNMFT